MTIIIPGELLSSRAHFRFLMAQLNYFSNCIFTSCPKSGEVTLEPHLLNYEIIFVMDRKLTLVLICSIIYFPSIYIAQTIQFAKTISVGVSSLSTKDCVCQYEPRGGYDYENSIVANLGLQWPIYHRLVVESNIGYFNRNYQSNVIDGQFMHSANRLYYIEFKKTTRNKYANLHLGFVIGNTKIHMTPLIGFGLFGRDEPSYDYTKYVYIGRPASYPKFPDDEPKEIIKEHYEQVRYWRSWSIDMGVSVNVKLLSNWYLKLTANRSKVYNWIEDDQDSYLLWQFGGGISYSFAKRVKEDKNP